MKTLGGPEVFETLYSTENLVSPDTPEALETPETPESPKPSTTHDAPETQPKPPPNLPQLKTFEIKGFFKKFLLEIILISGLLISNSLAFFAFNKYPMAILIAIVLNLFYNPCKGNLPQLTTGQYPYPSPNYPPLGPLPLSSPAVPRRLPLFPTVIRCFQLSPAVPHHPRPPST